MLRISKLWFSKGTFKLNINNLVMNKGELVMLIGPNGSGKTSFLKTLAGITEYSGEVFFEDKLMDSLSYKERAKIMAYLPQRINQSEILVKDFILMGRFPYTNTFGYYSLNDHEISKETASKFFVDRYMERDLFSLSQGEFQRVLIAKTFVQKAKILLLDEPSTSLDIGHKHSAKKQILSYKNSNPDSIIFVSTHEPELFGDIATSFVMLKEGKIFKQGQMSQYEKKDINELFDF